MFDRSIFNVIKALHSANPGEDTFVQRHIKLPTEDEARDQAQIFFDISGFPKNYPFGMIWATIDGTVSKKQLIIDSM